MFSKGRRKGTIRFTVKMDAEKVQLAGDFNNWIPTTMRRQKDGGFVCEVPLPPGQYQYKFIVDGEWVLDRDNSTWTMNPYGTLNNVVAVG